MRPFLIVCIIAWASSAHALVDPPITDANGRPAKITHTMRRGSINYTDVPTLRSQLYRAGVASRDLVDVEHPEIYDAAVEAAVIRFQVAFGMTVDQSPRPALGKHNQWLGATNRATRAGLNLQQEPAPSWDDLNGRFWRVREQAIACRQHNAPNRCFALIKRMANLARKRAPRFQQLMQFWPEAALAVSLVGLVEDPWIPGPEDPASFELWRWIERPTAIETDIKTLHIDDPESGASASIVEGSGLRWPDVQGELIGATRAQINGLALEGTFAPLVPSIITQRIAGLRSPRDALSQPTVAPSAYRIQLFIVAVNGVPVLSAADVAFAFGNLASWLPTRSRGLRTLEITGIEVINIALFPTCSTLVAPEVANAILQLPPGSVDGVVMIDPTVRECGGAGFTFGVAGVPFSALTTYRGSALSGIAAHEIGHQWGLGHAGTCDGPWDWVGVCTTDEYGDSSDPQGYPYKWPDIRWSPAHMAMLGWIGPSDIRLVRLGESGDFDLTGLEALVVERGDAEGFDYWINNDGGWHARLSTPRGYGPTTVLLPVGTNGETAFSGLPRIDGYNNILQAVSYKVFRLTRAGASPQPTPTPQPTPRPGDPPTCRFGSTTHQLQQVGNTFRAYVEAGEQLAVSWDSTGAYRLDTSGFGGLGSNMDLAQPYLWLPQGPAQRPLQGGHAGSFHIRTAGIVSADYTAIGVNGVGHCRLEIIATASDYWCSVTGQDHYAVGEAFSPIRNVSPGDQLWTYGWAGDVDKLEWLICGSAVPCGPISTGLWENLRLTQQPAVAGVVLEARRAGKPPRICTYYVTAS